MTDSVQHDLRDRQPAIVERAPIIVDPPLIFRRALVFGATGQIGCALLPLLHAEGIAVRAVSRQPPHDAEAAGLQWIRADLEHPEAQVPHDCDVIFSLGPLDAFSRWQERVGPIAPRVVAFGSTSIATKNASSDAAERALAQRLRTAEDKLMTFAASHAISMSILRPTLVYGCGRDRTLTRIAALARRHGLFALPRSAIGLRQPVHVDDLAAAALACARQPNCGGRAYDLPGGETVCYRDMVARVLAAFQPRPRLLSLPDGVFRLLLRSASAFGALGDAGRGVVDRLDQDLVFDAAAAHTDFRYAPRAFDCDARMFELSVQSPT